MVRDQLTDLTTKCHARKLRLSNVSHWPLLQATKDYRRTLRKYYYDVPPEDESSSENVVMQLESSERVIQFKRRERKGP